MTALIEISPNKKERDSTSSSSPTHRTSFDHKQLLHPIDSIMIHCARIGGLFVTQTCALLPPTTSSIGSTRHFGISATRATLRGVATFSALRRPNKIATSDSLRSGTPPPSPPPTPPLPPSPPPTPRHLYTALQHLHRHQHPHQQRGFRFHQSSTERQYQQRIESERKARKASDSEVRWAIGVLIVVLGILKVLEHDFKGDDQNDAVRQHQEKSRRVRKLLTDMCSWRSQPS